MEKNSSDYFQLSIFQRKIPELLPIKLNIKKEETESLKVKSYSLIKVYHTKSQINLSFNDLKVVKIFTDHLKVCSTSHS